MSNHKSLLGWEIITLITIYYFILVAFDRNHMCAKSQAALSATQTQAPFGNTWRQCMAQRLMSPRSSVGTYILGPRHHEILATIHSPGHLAGRLREPLVSRRTSATLPQNRRSVCKWKRSRRRSPWYVICFPSGFVKAILAHLKELGRALRGTRLLPSSLHRAIWFKEVESWVTWIAYSRVALHRITQLRKEFPEGFLTGF